MAHVELSSAGQPICAWTENSRKFEIHLPPDVIGRLGTDSWVAFKRVPRRGLEIGGILLGRIESRDGTTTYWIEGFVPVESEHRSGPSYVLSESDFGRLQEALTKNGASSIGIYRSQTRSEQLALQQPDAELFGRCFDTREALFLMLGPVPATAALFIRADGTLKCVHEFPLVSTLSSSLIVRRSSTTPQVDLPAQPAPKIQAASVSLVRQLEAPRKDDTLSVSEHALIPQPPPESQRTAASVDSHPSGLPVKKETSGVSSRRPIPPQPPTTALKKRFSALLSAYRSRVSGSKKGLWILAAAFFCLVIVATVTARSYLLPRAAPPAARASEYLRLTVERAGSSLRVRWDRNSPVVRGATHAVLHIQDGGLQSDRDLAPSEFDAGSITYEPKSSELTFRLDVYSVQPHATGSVQVVNFSSQPANPAAPPAGPNIQAAPKHPPYALLPVLTSVARTESDSTPPPAAPLLAKKDETEEIRSPALSPTDEVKEEFRTPVPRSSEKRSPEKTETIVLDTRVAAPPIVVGSPQPRLPVPEGITAPLPHREPSVDVVPEPVSGSRLGHLVGKVPLLRKLRKQDRFTEPVPVNQVQPSFGMLRPQSLVRPASVGVKVYVGESGTVKAAEVVEYGDPPNFNLANAALAAARLWTFKPARLEDAAVSSEVILHFRFNP